MRGGAASGRIQFCNNILNSWPQNWWCKVEVLFLTLDKTRVDSDSETNTEVLIFSRLRRVMRSQEISGHTTIPSCYVGKLPAVAPGAILFIERMNQVRLLSSWLVQGGVIIFLSYLLYRMDPAAEQSSRLKAKLIAKLQALEDEQGSSNSRKDELHWMEMDLTVKRFNLLYQKALGRAHNQ